MQLCSILTLQWRQCLISGTMHCLDSVISSNWKTNKWNNALTALSAANEKPPKRWQRHDHSRRPGPFNCFGFGSQIHLLSSFASTSSGGVTTKTTTSTAFKFVLMLKNQSCRVRWKLELDAIWTAGFVLQGALSWAVMHNEGSESEPVSACRLDKGKAREIVKTRISIVLPKCAV